jgi:hypothetical protein
VKHPNKNELMKKLESEGIKGASPYSRWRFVTHYGVDSEDIDYVLEVMANAMAS